MAHSYLIGCAFLCYYLTNWYVLVLISIDSHTFYKMTKFQLLSSNKYSRTKSWITGLYTFIFVFIYFLIIWILFGEFNILGLNFIISPNSHQYVDAMGQTYTNDAQIDPRIFYFLFIPGIFYFASVTLIHYCFKQTGWDIIPIVFSFWLAWIVLILSGAFQNPWSIWVLIGRIILVATTFFGLFFIFNYLINLIISKSSFAPSFFSSALDQEISKKENTEVLKKLRNEEVIIDVLAENIFLKNKKIK